MADDALQDPQAPASEAGQGRGAKDKDQNNDKDQGIGESRTARWPWLVAGLLLLGLVAAVLFEVFAPKPDVWTDDAYVMVHYATIAPRVSGQVAIVQVNDNQTVKAGQVLVMLDPSDYEARVAAAKAEVARDSAQVDYAAANIARQPPLIEQQQAAVASSQAKLGFARSDARRYGNLAETGAGTVQQRQQADTTTREAQASLDSARAALEAAKRQMQVLQAQRAAFEGTVEADLAQLELATLNLGYTTIVAPVDGVVGERSVQVGDYVGPGSALMTVVPLDQVYIEANYREVALRHVRKGQRVTIHVDAYNVDLDGIVDSMPPATGAIFAPIAPNNATGNFTKIVQRLPVKIVVAPNQLAAKLLRAGFSVETTIHTGLADVVGEQEAVTDRVNSH